MSYSERGTTDARRDPPVYQTLRVLYREDDPVAIAQDELNNTYTGTADPVIGFLEDDIRAYLQKQQEADADEKGNGAYALEKGRIRRTAWSHPRIDIYLKTSDDGDHEAWVYTLDDSDPAADAVRNRSQQNN